MRTWGGTQFSFSLSSCQEIAFIPSLRPRAREQKRNDLKERSGESRVERCAHSRSMSEGEMSAFLACFLFRRFPGGFPQGRGRRHLSQDEGDRRGTSPPARSSRVSSRGDTCAVICRRRRESSSARGACQASSSLRQILSNASRDRRTIERRGSLRNSLSASRAEFGRRAESPFCVSRADKTRDKRWGRAAGPQKAMDLVEGYLRASEG